MMQCFKYLRHKSVCLSLRCILPSASTGQQTRFISTWQEVPSGEYGQRNKAKRPSLIKQVVNGVKRLPDECVKWTEEFVYKSKFPDYDIHITHGDYDVLHKFDNFETIEEWTVTTDRSMMEGQSQAEFLLGPNKTGIFRGFLNTTVPKDGKTKAAGYCNIRSPAVMKSFQRLQSLDLSQYTHLVMRVRGDGRPYQIQFTMDRYYDICWNDQYTYTLFTRGGPYWQTALIPFSKFFICSKGVIQDNQERIHLDNILNIGLTLGDGAMGAFQLEIDYISVINDQRHKEHFAYEMYESNMDCVK